MGSRMTKRRERRRAGRAVKQRVREQWKVVRRNNRRTLLTAIGFTAAGLGLALALAVALDAHPFVVGLMSGIGVMTIPLYVLLIKFWTGIAAREFGGDAEQWTAEELDKLDGRLWQVFHDVPVEWGNVDHVAVGPGRIYAIETKWTTAGGRFRHQGAIQAARQADRLRSALSSHGVERQVIPLLVIWGYGVAADLEHRAHLDEQTQTRIVAGGDSALWLAKMQQAANGLAADRLATLAVRTLMEADEQVTAKA